MDAASVSEACLSLATVEWNREVINDDHEVCIVCESMQSICQGILSTMDELLTVDMNELTVQESVSLYSVRVEMA